MKSAPFGFYNYQGRQGINHKMVNIFIHGGKKYNKKKRKMTRQNRRRRRFEKNEKSKEMLCREDTEKKTPNG